MTLYLQTLFGREADKLEHANDDEQTYYLMEKESLVNRYISVPREGGLNCAVFVAGIVEAVLTGTGFVSIDISILSIQFKGFFFSLQKFQRIGIKEQLIW